MAGTGIILAFGDILPPLIPFISRTLGQSVGSHFGTGHIDDLLYYRLFRQLPRAVRQLEAGWPQTIYAGVDYPDWEVCGAAGHVALGKWLTHDAWNSRFKYTNLSSLPPLSYSRHL